jgi:phytoene dehydrogenase-like protein
MTGNHPEAREHVSSTSTSINSSKSQSTSSSTSTSTSSRYDAIVVGAGPGGSTIAALLSKEGYRVLLVDKNPRAGGRMMTIQRDGFSYELFPINCVPARNSLFERVVKELGKEALVDVIIPKKLGLLLYEDSGGHLRQWAMGSSNLGLLKVLGIHLWDFKALYQTIKLLKEMATMAPAEIDGLDDVSAMTYLDRFTVPRGLYTYVLATFSEGALEMSADKTSAAEMIKLFQVTVKHSGGRYYQGGIGHVFEVIASVVPERGGDAIFNTRVKKINVQDNHVTGITTEDGQTYFAPLVVSNAGLKQTVLKLVGAEYFPQEYVEHVRGLEVNLACAGYRWVLDKPVLEYSTYIYYPEGCVLHHDQFKKMAEGTIKPETSYIYLGTTSLYPGLAPPGKQLVYACMSCLGDTRIDIKPYLAYVKERVKRIMPDLFNHVEREEVFGPSNVPGLGNDVVMPGEGGEAYGLALSVGQTGSKQPKGDSPVDGLYFVGCDAGGSGLGTHQAVDSACNVSRLIGARRP